MPSTVEHGGQSAAIAYLDGLSSERIDTHISHVFLSGDRALKLKRHVKFPYLDFSTVEARRQSCEAEVRINRRTAPELYLGVRAVTREDSGDLALDGDGEVVDWVVEMARFDQLTLFDRQVQAGTLDDAVMRDLADVIAEFHEEAEVETIDGGARTLGMIIDNNAETFRGLPEGLFDVDEVDTFARDCRAEWEGVSPLLDARRERGRVRHCHGDLHLRNICQVDGRPILFDAIEFDDAFATIDVLYDLAFLLMDLEHRGHRDLASAVMNHYLDRCPDDDGLAALPLFMAVRAAIRAHVTAAMVASVASADSADDRALAEARDYLVAARELLRPVAPVVVAVGGLSGSGKTTLARGLAPLLGRAPGGRVLRADVERKRLMGVAPTVRLPDDAYGHEVTQRTFERLFEKAAEVLAAGQALVLDSVFAAPIHRAMAEQAARDAGVPFLGLWLEAPEAERIDRVEARRDDASDADARVIGLQAAYDPGDMDWAHIPAESDARAVMATARELLTPLSSAPKSAS